MIAPIVEGRAMGVFIPVLFIRVIAPVVEGRVIGVCIPSTTVSYLCGTTFYSGLSHGSVPGAMQDCRADLAIC